MTPKDYLVAQMQQQENERALMRHAEQQRHARAALHRPHAARKRSLLAKYRSTLSNAD